MHRRHMATTALIATFATATAVAAQSNAGSGQQSEGSQYGEVIPLASWNYDEVTADGWSAQDLLDGEAYDQNGEDIGEVEDLIFGPDGEILAVIAEVGGFWDIGDTHVSVPWSQVERTADGLTLPLTEDTVEDYDLFSDETMLPRDALNGEIVAGVDDAPPPGRTWRLRELVGDYARLLSGEEWINYGYVNDVIVNDGAIVATLVSVGSPYGYGVFGYPSYANRGAGWDAADPYYDLPYSPEDINGLDRVGRTTY